MTRRLSVGQQHAFAPLPLSILNGRAHRCDTYRWRDRFVRMLDFMYDTSKKKKKEVQTKVQYICITLSLYVGLSISIYV